MIDPHEIENAATRLGVSIVQIRRDHLISHVLAAFAANAPSIRFYGGTALNRTLLVDRRLSEDIDLMVPDRAVDVDHVIGRRLLSAFGEIRSIEGPRHGGMRTVGLEASGGLSVRVQFVEAQVSDDRWRWVRRPVALTYSDLPESAEMVAPDDAGFVAMKIAAYLDRHAPRDLFDLAGLAETGAITSAATDRYRHVTGSVTTVLDYERLRPSTAAAWDPELAHQVARVPSPHDALSIVRTAVVRALGPPATGQ